MLGTRRLQVLFLCRLVVAALVGLLACDSEPAGKSQLPSSNEALPSCADIELETIYRFYGRNIGALFEAKDGCGDVVVALADGGEELRVDGTRCARHFWPAGFQADWFTAHAFGVLVTSYDARKVVSLDAQGPLAWLDLPAQPTATFVVSVSQSPCGERYAVLYNNGDEVLLRLGVNGEVLWQRPGFYPDVLATCDGVYFTSTLSEMSSERALLLQRIDPAGNLVAEATLLSGYCFAHATLLGAVPGGIAVSTSGCGDSDLVQVRSPSGALLWSQTLRSCYSWSEPPCSKSISTYAVRAFEWPKGHTAWLEVVLGPCAKASCAPHVDLVSHTMDGTEVLRRTLAIDTHSLAAPIGGSLWLQSRVGIDNHLLRLGPCVLP